MHAWDCRCGIRNAPSFTTCRSCGQPAGMGRPIRAGHTPPHNASGRPPSLPRQPQGNRFALRYLVAAALVYALFQAICHPAVEVLWTLGVDGSAQGVLRNRSIFPLANLELSIPLAVPTEERGFYSGCEIRPA